MRSHRLKLFLASVLLGACFQKLDTAASSQATTAPTDALVTQIDPSADPIALSPTDAATASDPCDKTRQDKTQILTAFCARCHSGAAPVGLPPWDFVLDDQKLVTETWVRAGQPAERFVIPGDPDHSALYQRMAVAQDMPPQPTDLGTAPNPKPSAADGTVIREWILNCLGATARHRYARGTVGYDCRRNGGQRARAAGVARPAARAGRGRQRADGCRHTHACGATRHRRAGAARSTARPARWDRSSARVTFTAGSRKWVCN